MGSLWLYSVAVVGLLLCTSSGAHALGLAKSVNVSVRAKWEGTSLLLEAGLAFNRFPSRVRAEFDATVYRIVYLRFSNPVASLGASLKFILIIVE